MAWEELAAGAGQAGANGQERPARGEASGQGRGLRVLLIDFDVFNTRGGGQTFYRRVIERHPNDLVFYPSRGPDIRASASLPPNARPFAVDPPRDAGLEQRLPADGLSGVAHGSIQILASLGRALQGQTFDVVEVPSYRAYAHLVRPVLDSYGILVDRISVSLLGWLSVSLSKADANNPYLAEIREEESRNLAAADVCYTISTLHAVENVDHTGALGMVEMRDALEEVAVPEPSPPPGGPPDLWYVGRFDLAKGPDLFLAIAARMDRSSYRALRLAGPDNDWEPEGGRWSDQLRGLAARLGVDAQIELQLSDKALRSEVYSGRSVIVIPSRTDSFNLVALEALAHGTPILLSRHTGAAGYLAENHPRIAPPIIEPEDVEASAAELGALLRDYPARVAALRAQLRQDELPRPRLNFLHTFWRDATRATGAAPDAAMVRRLRQVQVLDTPAAQAWRRRPSLGGRLTVAVIGRNAEEALRRTLASLAWSPGALGEILVVDDGSDTPIADPGDGIRLLRQGARGLAAACNRAASVATGSHVLFLSAGDLLGPENTRKMDEVVRDMEKAGAEAMQLPCGWLPESEPAPEEPGASAGCDAPALLCARLPLIEAGGFAASDDNAALVIPPELHLATGSGYEAPLVWRLRESAKAWRTAGGGMDRLNGLGTSAPEDEAIMRRNAA